MRFLLDEDLPPLAAEVARGLGLDAVSVHELGRRGNMDRDQLRFAWELTAADGSPIVAGLGLAELADDGRLQRVTGFWGDLR